MTTMTPHFTRTDYLGLPEGFPAELVEGHLLKEATPVSGFGLVPATLFS